MTEIHLRFLSATLRCCVSSPVAMLMADALFRQIGRVAILGQRHRRWRLWQAPTWLLSHGVRPDETILKSASNQAELCGARCWRLS